MPQWRDFLERFRPAGAPGAGAGVPVDRGADVAAELLPVLAVLDDVQAEAERIRADAAASGLRIRQDGAERARKIDEEARARIDAVEADAYAQARMRAVPDDAAAVNELRARAAERIPGYVDRVVLRAHALLAELTEGTTPTPGPGEAAP
ncbi:hypothetical protein [Nocardia sp. NPDC049707]|uniref:hypothetical protein n=1 Tax=Nocardia sp. NPDC049707 TaxID=3154735 RepID=UPI00344A002A